MFILINSFIHISRFLLNFNFSSFSNITFSHAPTASSFPLFKVRTRALGMYTTFIIFWKGNKSVFSSRSLSFSRAWKLNERERVAGRKADSGQWVVCVFFVF